MEGEKEKEEKKGEKVEFLGATVQIDQSVKGNMGLMSELYTYCIYMKGATFKFSFCQWPLLASLDQKGHLQENPF